jgi:hypothetical protein
MCCVGVGSERLARETSHEGWGTYPMGPLHLGVLETLTTQAWSLYLGTNTSVLSGTTPAQAYRPKGLG